MRSIVGRWAGIFMAGALLGACATAEPLYVWSDYQSDLLSYYKNPGELDKFSERLLEDIEKAEAEGRVPPGLYAEYGYAMLERGDTETAIEYFLREQEAWPEASFLMAGVISRLSTVDEDSGDMAASAEASDTAAEADITGADEGVQQADPEPDDDDETDAESSPSGSNRP